LKSKQISKDEKKVHKVNLKDTPFNLKTNYIIKKSHKVGNIVVIDEIEIVDISLVEEKK